MPTVDEALALAELYADQVDDARRAVDEALRSVGTGHEVVSLGEVQDLLLDVRRTLTPAS